MIKLIVGLGNPGEQYQKTRHNAGFWLLEQLAKNFDAKWRTEKKFFAEYSKIFIANCPVHLLKPQAFMNASGRAVIAIAQFYDIDIEEILVVHDELDLPEGISRLKIGGGHGGHNGLRDIISVLGGREFMRLRIGINHPGNRNDVIHYVLKAPSKVAREKIDMSILQSTHAIDILMQDGSEKAMHWLHSEKIS